LFLFEQQSNFQLFCNKVRCSNVFKNSLFSQLSSRYIHSNNIFENLHDIAGIDGYWHDVWNIFHEDIPNHHQVSLKKLLSLHLVSSRPGFVFILNLSHENGHDITTYLVYVRALRGIILHFIDSVDTNVLSDFGSGTIGWISSSEILEVISVLSILHFTFDLQEIGGDETSDLSLEKIKLLSIEETFENTGIIEFAAELVNPVITWTCYIIKYLPEYPIIFRAIFTFGSAICAAVPKWFMLIELWSVSVSSRNRW